MSFMYPRIVE